MEKFGIFNMLEQFGALFKNDERKTSQDPAVQTPPIGATDKTKATGEYDNVAAAMQNNPQLNAASLEKFILNHEEISRRIDRQNLKK